VSVPKYISDDFERLRADHSFKKHKDGLKLYYRFRKAITKSENEYEELVKIAKALGTSVQTLYNRRTRELKGQVKKNIPAQKEIKRLQNKVHDVRAVSQYIPIEVDVSQPLETSQLAAMHQQTLLQVSREIEEILQGKYIKYIGKAGFEKKIRKRDDPRFMNVFTRLVEAQRKLIEDRITMFGMLKDVDSLQAVKELEDRLTRSIEFLASKDPSLLTEFVQHMEGIA